MRNINENLYILNASTGIVHIKGYTDGRCNVKRILDENRMEFSSEEKLKEYCKKIT